MKCLSLAVLLLSAASSIAQGPLFPDGGPQPTMKTLQQVEPRTAIPGGTGTVTITAGGSYYLTGNLTVAEGDGIILAADHVTLDLNGFSVSSMSAGPSGTGIALGDQRLAIVIRNGHIGGGFARGVSYVQGGEDPEPPFSVRISDLMVGRVTVAGIDLGNPNQATVVERCGVFAQGAPVGIVAAMVRDCTVAGAGITASIVRDCTVQSPGTEGIAADVVDHCVVSLPAGGSGIRARVVANSSATGGGASDIVSAGVVHNVWAEGSSGEGHSIQAVVAGNSVGRRNGDGGPDSGSGVNATVVHAAVGVGVDGAGVEGEVVSSTKGMNTGTSALRGGIEGAVVLAASGQSVNMPGISGEEAVVGGSRAKSQSGTALSVVNGVVSGSAGHSGSGFGGILARNGVVGGSRGEGGQFGITTDTGEGCISDSLGLGRDFTGIYSDVTTGSHGVGHSYGIGGLLIQGSAGFANGPPPADDIFGLFTFDTN